MVMDSHISPSAVPGGVSSPTLVNRNPIEQLLEGVSYWNLAVTLLVLCVTYDQGEYAKKVVLNRLLVVYTEFVSADLWLYL